ncbi:hypothetical protein K9L05_01400 [Candidatus Babeliales bacterium]|nr:hypothetical protein [Candidatus Babeliales bacterium]MCF7899287.1 hypothetical protein [Candidatus Babeliales bacterium]
MNFKNKLILFCMFFFGLNIFTQNIFSMQRCWKLRPINTKGAGILPYAVMQDGEIYFLFNCTATIKGNDEYWGVFVDEFRRNDRDLKDTAIRCFNNDMSNFIFEKLTREQLDDNKKVVHPNTGYEVYFVKINLAQFTNLNLSNFAQILLEQRNTAIFRGFALVSVLYLKMGVNATIGRNLVNLDCNMAYILNLDRSFSFRNQIVLGRYLSTELSYRDNKNRVLNIIQNIIREEQNNN